MGSVMSVVSTVSAVALYGLPEGLCVSTETKVRCFSPEFWMVTMCVTGKMMKLESNPISLVHPGGEIQHTLCSQASQTDSVASI